MKRMMFGTLAKKKTKAKLLEHASNCPRSPIRTGALYPHLGSGASNSPPIIVPISTGASNSPLRLSNGALHPHMGHLGGMMGHQGRGNSGGRHALDSTLALIMLKPCAQGHASSELSGHGRIVQCVNLRGSSPSQHLAQETAARRTCAPRHMCCHIRQQRSKPFVFKRISWGTY